MSDMLKVIEPKSDQINAEDLIGRDMTITVKGVTVRAGTEQPVSIEFNGSDKVFRPCKTVSRILVAAWGPDTSVYSGRSLTLYRDPKVKWGGMEVGGIRVRAMSHIDAPLKLALAESKKNRTITVVQPLKIESAPQTATFTIDQARSDLEFAADLDDLKALWSRKIMAPFRDELQSVLNDRKAVLLRNDGTLSDENPTATEGMPDADRGEPDPRAEMVERLVSDLSIAACGPDIEAADTLYQQHRAGFADDQVAEVERALAGARAKVGGR